MNIVIKEFNKFNKMKYVRTVKRLMLPCQDLNLPSLCKNFPSLKDLPI